MRRRRQANAPRRPAGWINVLLILLSLSPLALGEAYLRSIGYGYDHRLLRPADGGDRVELNVEAYRRYFPANELVSKSRIPNLFKRDVSFGKRKAANVFRVFCFGGSTTAGDFAHRNFPELLGEMLSRVVRGRDIEVINLGITTINSYQVAEFVAEAVEFDPDLFVVYTGHNEIYGPLGVASSAPGSASYWLTSAFLLLQQFKVFQLLQQLFIDLTDRTSDEDKTDSLFRTMVESPLAPASPLRATS
ncbi:MAG: SGNH/GDSL hydrolase family protein, partial [Gammaproteobacteria bacterium]|nr:SGNH/GDSL hydrolase family protein [Gammaproteobacteria bacterium]